MITHDLRYFKLSEFKHPELVDPVAASMLDEIRHQYGKELTLTDDARLPGDRPVGSVADSLHYKGQAFDIRTKDKNAVDLFSLLDAVYNVSKWIARGTKSGVEVELVSSTTDHHLHVGFWLGERSYNTLTVRAE